MEVKIFKNSSVFISWFFSYLIMLGLVLLVSIGLYFFAYNVIDEQGGKVNRTMLEKVQTEIDSYFMDARNMVVSLMIDHDVQKASRTKHSFELSDRAMLYEIYRDITNLKIATKDFSHLFIYFVHADSLISDQGHVDNELFYELYYKNDEISKEDFYKMLQKKWSGEIRTITNSKGEREILLLKNNFPRGSEGQNATFGVSITYSEMSAWMQELNWDSGTELLVLGEDGLLCSTGVLGEQMIVENSGEIPNLTKTGQIRIEESDYRVVAEVSQETGLCYAALTPIGAVREGAREIQTFMLSWLIVCTTIGVIVAYILTNKNYRPLRRAMSSFGEYKPKEDVENEYQWLHDQTIHFLDENKEIKKRFYNSKKILKDQYIYRLITSPYEEKKSGELDFVKDDVFKESHNLVVTLYLGYEDDTPWKADVDSSLFRFIIMNVMTELLDGRCGFELVEFMDCFVGVFNGKREWLETREEPESVMNQLQEFLRKRMKLQVTAVFGEVQSGLEGIYISYQTAKEASEYKEQSVDSQIVWYDDIRDRHTLYRYPIEVEQRIINAIKAGQQENVCLWMNSVIEENFRSREITLAMKKCLLSELLGTLIKGAEMGGSIELMTKLLEEKGIPEYSQEHKAKEYFYELIVCLCENIRKNEDAKRENRQFGKQVMEYVQQNYHDPDLNISITALHFGITPSYLSALFKEQTGQNLLEYINQTRVTRVKELLDEGLNLTEICALTGFRSSGALIRVFKKSTGVTPGQMKKMSE